MDCSCSERETKIKRQHDYSLQMHESFLKEDGNCEAEEQIAWDISPGLQ